MRTNWDDFRFFLAVARHGTLSGAGNHLGVDHATVGRRITALEESLSKALFNRSPQGYSLTDAGLKMMPIAEQVESDAMRAIDELSDHHADLSGPVRIGAHEGVASFLLAEGAAQICRQHPMLEVQLLTVPRSFSLSKREADFVITGSRPQSGRVKIKKIASYVLHIYGEASYLEGQSPIQCRKDLRRVRGIGYIPDMIFDKELDYIPSVDPSLKAHLTSNSLHVQLQMALGGAGVCILPDYVARDHPNLIPILAPEVEIKRDLWLTIHEDIAHLTRIKTVADFITHDIVSRLKATANI
ncbi:LysR family transcriptional regulator [Maritalea sp.]|uniref:LysR family transcriptional regulator n=1 Tax=Maritalea sp. TaxID=2003361 RepID=UPI003EF1DFA7